ncbi:unnamed protein product, partial [Prorocentrum cordatum]
MCPRPPPRSPCPDRSPIGDSAASAGLDILSVHICTPLELMNATPIPLSLQFHRLAKDEGARPLPPVTVRVEPFSVCDSPPQLDPPEAFGVSVLLADAGGCPATGTGGPTQQLATDILSGEADSEEIVPLCGGRSSAGSPELLVTLARRGLAVCVSCSRWLVDRTGLGIRVICSSDPLTDQNAPLPQADGYISLLGSDHPPASSNNSREPVHYLALCDEPGQGWTATARIGLPDSGAGGAGGGVSE